jgi:hypothetical protein
MSSGPGSRSTSHARRHRHCAGARLGGAGHSFPPFVSVALSVVAVLGLLVHLPGVGLGSRPSSAMPSPSIAGTRMRNPVARHHVATSAGSSSGSAPSSASRSSFRPAPCAARRPWALVSSPWPGSPAAQILYTGDGRHISLFVARKPSRPLPRKASTSSTAASVHVRARSQQRRVVGGPKAPVRRGVLGWIRGSPGARRALHAESAQPASEATRSDVNASARVARAGLGRGPAPSTRGSKQEGSMNLRIAVSPWASRSAP